MMDAPHWQLQALLEETSDATLQKMLRERNVGEEDESRERQIARLEVLLMQERALLQDLDSLR